MTALKKHCWIFLVPLLAIIYWKKSKEVVIPNTQTHFFKDSISVQLPADDLKTVVLK